MVDVVEEIASIGIGTTSCLIVAHNSTCQNVSTLTRWDSFWALKRLKRLIVVESLDSSSLNFEKMRLGKWNLKSRN
jgi:hypothetical protein